jgi:hypothetical protein
MLSLGWRKPSRLNQGRAARKAGRRTERLGSELLSIFQK